MKKIFLIDDDSDDKEVFELALAKMHFKTLLYYAQDGEKALDMIYNGVVEQPDYIFLDMNMPKLNGLGFLTLLREKKFYNSVPVFIYSTSSEGPDIERCKQLGGKLVTKHSSFNLLCIDLEKLLV